MYRIRKYDLQQLLSSWAKKAQVFTPQLEEGQVMLLPYEESKFTMNYVNFAFPVKEHLFKQREILFSWSNDNGNIKLETPIKVDEGENIYFGIRPCDAYGIRYMDKFFLEGYRDEFYAGNRETAVIIAVNCTEPGENCFCSSMGTGPFADSGYDLLFTPFKDEYFVEVGTEKGKTLITYATEFFVEAAKEFEKEKEKLDRTVSDKFAQKINLKKASLALNENFNNPIWQELSKDCISCTGCTSVCPTCTCFNVVEETSGNNCGCRVKCWDSCQSDSFTRNANEHNPRSRESRFRYRIYDKFKYIEDRFGMKGCTGCGRCVDVCPASIDVAEVINKMADIDPNVKGHGGE